MSCANLANPALAAATRSRGPVVAGMLAEHEPPPIARSCGVAPAAAPGLLVEHRPLRAARGRGRGLTVAAAPGPLAGHRPLRVARGHGPAATAELQWTCDLNSSDGSQRQTTCSSRRCS